MKTTLKNSFVAIAILSLAMLLLLPTATKFLHLFANHEHKVCTDNSTHIHEQIIDCEYLSYHLTPQIEFTPHQHTLIVIKKIRTQNFNYYAYLSEYQELSFALRGPPQNS
ncbi:hypothetical protein IMCC3317_09070 [Kordia antarctica]|uniref:Uncharacterized protein n=1 Tax=Kordia antarctica TaxID=1218801 RepID=A0A7L4ZGK5_9FLAO|nr:hypothetical protein [Kordia antarctica]QHI35561.1 hypothetical protein IMCC3317_09070 [Kordia antarctica]